MFNIPKKGRLPGFRVGIADDVPGFRLNDDGSIRQSAIGGETIPAAHRPQVPLQRWKPIPGFRIEGPDGVASHGQQVHSAAVENPYFPGLAGMSDMLAFRIPSLPNIDSATSLPSPADGDDGGIQPVRKPVKCSGPNSKCSLPRKIRANGVFRDPRYPMFLLCMPCYVAAYGRTPDGEDT